MNIHIADKIAYFFIAFALYLLLRAFSEVHTAPLTNILLHCVYPVRCVEIFSFGLAIVCFLVLCMRHMFI